MMGKYLVLKVCKSVIYVFAFLNIFFYVITLFFASFISPDILLWQNLVKWDLWEVVHYRSSLVKDNLSFFLLFLFVLVRNEIISAQCWQEEEIKCGFYWSYVRQTFIFSGSLQLHFLFPTSYEVVNFLYFGNIKAGKSSGWFKESFVSNVISDSVIWSDQVI